MRLIIARHGETDSNTAQIIQGHLNVELNERGKAQAFELAVRLKEERIDFIYSSDLSRARQTAEPVSKALGLPIIYRQELRERHYGVYQGQAFIKYEEELRASGESRYSFKPYLGESFIEMDERVRLFIEFLRLNHSNDNVILVSHSGTNRVLIKTLLNKDFSELGTIEQSNAGISILDIDAEGRSTPYVLNCTRHLNFLGMLGGVGSEC